MKIVYKALLMLLAVAIAPTSGLCQQPQPTTVAPQFNITPIKLNWVSQINDRGQVAGAVDTSQKFNKDQAEYMTYRTSAIWQAGQVHVFPIYKKQGNCILIAINNQGTVAGTAGPADGFPGHGEWSDIHMFQRKSGQFHSLGTSGELLGQNNRGACVGYKEWPGGMYGFVARNGKMREIKNPLAEKFSQVAAISDDGYMVGMVFGAHIAPPNVMGSNVDRRYAYLWPPRGRPSCIESLPNIVLSSANGINARHDVIGYLNFRDDWVAYRNDSHYCHKDHAFIWRDGRMTVLDAGQSSMEALRPVAINDSGEIIGDGNDRIHKKGGPFLYVSGRLYPLISCIRPDADWQLDEVDSINNQGQIVGLGVLHGKHSAFLLTPVKQ